MLPGWRGGPTTGLTGLATGTALTTLAVLLPRRLMTAVPVLPPCGRSAPG